VDDWYWDRIDDDGLYDTPEEAALAGWAETPSAQARVVDVQPFDQGAVKGVYVTIQTDGHPHFHDQDIASCVQAPNGKWFENGSTGSDL
jgi:hypothetical protein